MRLALDGPDQFDRLFGSSAPETDGDPILAASSWRGGGERQFREPELNRQNSNGASVMPEPEAV